MGMITRVRGRLRSLHSLPKLDPEERDEKIAETVCLLSVVFLLPYCSKGHAPLLLSLGGWVVATYSVLVLPVLISANYKYPARWLKKLFHKIPDLFRFLRPFGYPVVKFFLEMHFMEQFFISLHGLYSFTCQLLFFTVCDWALKGYAPQMTAKDKDKTVLLALTSILFYSVFSYFIRRIKDICIKGTRHTFTRRVTMGNFIKFFCRIILEWLKAIVVIICLREQGIHYHPTMAYFIITFLYYVATEKLLIEILTSFLELFSIEALENLEHLYVPLVLNIYTCLIAVCLQAYVLTFHISTFFLFSFYFTVYLRIKDTYFNYWKVIEDERKVYASFRVATSTEIEEWDDICAVCLNELTRAKITPCKHLFHPTCLKQCLKVSFLCPLCKQNFAEEIYSTPESTSVQSLR